MRSLLFVPADSAKKLDKAMTSSADADSCARKENPCARRLRASWTSFGISNMPGQTLMRSPMCGAKTRKGTPCQRRCLRARPRCLNHGGHPRSGKRTPEGAETSRRSRRTGIGRLRSWPLPQCCYPKGPRSGGVSVIEATSAQVTPFGAVNGYSTGTGVP